MTPDDLTDRLLNGTRMPDGTRGSRPRIASRYYDLATAEHAITTVLQQRKRDIWRWMMSQPNRRESFSVRFDEPIGEFAVKADPYQHEPGHTAVVVLRIEGESVNVVTAFVDP